MTKREPTAREQVQEIADRQIESIRVLLLPEKSDVELSDDGTLDTVLTVDNEHVFRYSQEFAASYRDEDGTLDLEDLVDDCWDEISEYLRERFYEHGLSFDYNDRNEGEHYFCYLISTGGPGTEIRFYANHDLTLHRAEFWFLPWYDGASITVTADDTVQELWDQFAQNGTAEHIRNQAIG